MRHLITTLLTTALVSMTSAVFSQGACENETSYTYNGYTYDLVEVGDQCWFAQTLRTSSYINGDPIDFVGGSDEPIEWTNNTTGAYTYNEDGNHLYNWYAATSGVCPTGYGLPTDEDFINLEESLGMKRSELKKYGYRGSGINWRTEFVNAGFELDLAGIMVDNDGSLNDYSNAMYLWTNNGVKNENAIDRVVYNNLEFNGRHDNMWQTSDNKGHGMSVLCVKNDETDIAEFVEEFPYYFILPGDSSLEYGDLEYTFNALDTVYLDTNLTQLAQEGFTIVNYDGDTLVANRFGVLEHIEDYTGNVTGIFNDGPQHQTCGCIAWGFSGNGLDCYMVWQPGPPRQDCATICNNAGLSWSSSGSDLGFCGGFEEGPNGELIRNAITRGKNRTYELDKKHIDQIHIDMTGVVLSNDLVGRTVYLDEGLSIPYNRNKRFTSSRLAQPTPITNDALAFEFDGVTNYFEIGADGILTKSNIDAWNIAREMGGGYLSCRCFDCCAGYPNPLYLTFVYGGRAGYKNCTKACKGSGYSPDGICCGGCCGGYGTDFDPVGGESELYIVPGDTTWYYNEVGVNLNIYDTVYVDEEMTTFAKFGKFFVNDKEDSLYVDIDGVLKTADMINNLDRDFFSGPHHTVTCMCCQCVPSSGECYQVTVTSTHRRRPCATICEQNGYSSSFNGNGTGSDWCSNHEMPPNPVNDNTFDRSVRNEFVFNHEGFTITNFTGDIDLLDGLTISSSSENLSYIRGIYFEYEGREFLVGQDYTIIDVTPTVDADIGDPPPKKYRASACFCWSDAPECASMLRFGAVTASCLQICPPFNTYNPCGDSYGTTGVGGDVLFHFSSGPITLASTDYDAEINAQDTVSIDEEGTRAKAGYFFGNAKGEIFITDVNGILVPADNYNRRPDQRVIVVSNDDIDDIILTELGGPIHSQTCVCCCTAGQNQFLQEFVTGTRKSCASFCNNQPNCEALQMQPLGGDQQLCWDDWVGIADDYEDGYLNKNWTVNQRQRFGQVVEAVGVSSTEDLAVGVIVTPFFKKEYVADGFTPDIEDFAFMKGWVFSFENKWYRIGNDWSLEGGGDDPLPEWGGAAGGPQDLNVCACWGEAPECNKFYVYSTNLRKDCDHKDLCGTAFTVFPGSPPCNNPE